MKENYLIFTVEEHRLVLPVETIQRVVPAVAITPSLSSTPPIAGIINVEGQLVHVIDVRWQFEKKTRALDLNDRFIIASLEGKSPANHLLALWVDKVEDIVNGIVNEEGVLKYRDEFLFLYKLSGSC